ncbi:MAG: molybdopterin molybdotransferase MoeA [Pseudomonadota bacterium]
MLNVTDALAAVLANVPPLASETVSLTDAHDRVLHETIRAEREQPPFDRVMMDGIALRSSVAPGATLRCLGTVFAGAEPHVTIADDVSCVEVMTGAVLPPGTDCVVPVEELSRDGTHVTLTAEAVLAPGKFVHATGSDHASGTTLLSPGGRIGMTEIAAIASAGYAEVATSRLAKVTVIATGDELVPAGSTIESYQIRLSNGPALVSAVHATGLAVATLIHCPDARDRLAAVLNDALSHSDVVILSGGVSRGKADYVPDVLSSLGVERVFHRVAQKPGKPLWFGRSDTATVFGLPGNPVSALVTYRRFVVPYLVASAGLAAEPQLTVATTAPVQRLARLTRFVPVQSTYRGGEQLATPLGFNTSGDYAALTETAGFIEVPPGGSPLEDGTLCAFFPWQTFT